MNTVGHVVWTTEMRHVKGPMYSKSFMPIQVSTWTMSQSELWYRVINSVMFANVIPVMRRSHISDRKPLPQWLKNDDPMLLSVTTVGTPL